MPRLSNRVDDDEAQRSDVYSESAMEIEEEVAPVKKSSKSKARPKRVKADTPPPKEEEEEEEEEEEQEGDDDGEGNEDVYVVEAIINHAYVEGILKFHVRWKDFPKMADHTWEPEASFGDATEVLDEYIESVGGRQALAKVRKATGKKRGRKSANASNGTPTAPDSEQRNGKRARKIEAEEVNEESPDSSKPKVPQGNWEELIQSIDTMERQVGGLYILLTFKDGNRVKQPAQTVYRRCPQKMLQFYESHLSFKPASTPAQSASYEDFQ